MNYPLALSAKDYERTDRSLAVTDELLKSEYPGEPGSRQPLHTVYLPGDRYRASTPQEWGRDALAAAARQGGIGALCSQLRLDDSLADQVQVRVEAKLESEPIEDLRLDFEDGYGVRGDESEDNDVLAASREVATAVDSEQAPPFIGIRFKSFEASTRRRALRSLDLFVSSLVESGRLPAGLMLTLPKVSTVAQARAMSDVCARLEDVHGLPARSLRFEVQVEVPQLILGADGLSAVARLLHETDGRVTGLHYGTYDYSAAIGIAGQYQSLSHPAADHAKAVMQVAAAGTGVRVSDGSTNVLPVGTPESVTAAWALHHALVGRSLQRGFYQGWDLHPAQLVTRFIANFEFYRSGLPQAASRLRGYLENSPSGFLDEPATARALAGFILRGVQCGALAPGEVDGMVGVSVPRLEALAHHANKETRPTS
jgi:hypothetical protein